MSNKLTPVDEPFGKEVEKILATYPRQDGYLLTLFRVFANSIRFLNKGVFNLLDKESPLSLRERELVILRVTANLDCEYEWGVHVAAFGKAAKFTPEQIENTYSKKSDNTKWNRAELLLLRTVDEFYMHGRLEEKTRSEFENEWVQEQQLEIMALCGNYHTVCYVANTARLEGESFAAKFPEVTG